MNLNEDLFEMLLVDDRAGPALAHQWSVMLRTGPARHEGYQCRA
jgi:hypothetical protein